MKAEQTTLHRMMSGPNQQFEMPLYQRRYSWTDKHRWQLWRDVLRASELRGESKHFTGSVVSAPVMTIPGSVQHYRLVDGQQRMTTVHLLIWALAEHLENNPRAGDELGLKARQLREQYLFNEGATRDDRYKLRLNYADNPLWQRIMDGKFQGKAARGERETELMRGVRFFRDRFAEPGLDLAAVWEGFRRLEVVGILLQEGVDDMGVVFESLNSTGKALAQADLIRNNVLMSKSLDDQRDITEQHWHPMEQRFAEVEEGQFDRFMRDYLTLRTRILPNEDEVYLAFKQYREGKNVLSVVRNIDETSKLYLELLQPTHSAPAVQVALRDIAALKLSIVNPFLLELLEDREQNLLTDEQLEKALRVVESFLVRRAVLKERTSPLNKLFATLGRELDKDSDYVRSLERALVRFQDNKTDGFPDDVAFEQALREQKLYGRPVCKPLLVRLERGLNPKETFGGVLTIEHIMPQKPGPSWQAALGKTPDDDKTWREDHERLLHTLGNLTLTGYNSELGNLSFEEKKHKPIRAGDSEETSIPKGYKYSHLLLTRELVDKSEWNQGEIEARAKRLAKRATELFQMPSFTPEEVEALRAEGRQRARANTVERHLEEASLQLRQLFEELDCHLKALGDEEGVTVKRVINQQYIAYKAGSNFCDVKVMASQNVLKCWLNIPVIQLDDPLGLVRDMSQTGHASNAPAEVTLTLDSDMESFLELAEQALQHQVSLRATSSASGDSESGETVNFSVLPAEAQDVLARLSKWAADVGAKVKDTQNYRALRDRRSFVELYPRQRENGLILALKLPADEVGELTEGQLGGWLRRDSWLSKVIRTPEELEKAWPLIEAAHAYQKPSGVLSSAQGIELRDFYQKVLQLAEEEFTPQALARQNKQTLLRLPESEEYIARINMVKQKGSVEVLMDIPFEDVVDFTGRGFARMEHSSLSRGHYSTFLKPGEEDMARQLLRHLNRHFQAQAAATPGEQS